MKFWVLIIYAIPFKSKAKLFSQFCTYSVLYNIMGNDFVGQEYKNRLRKAAKMGRDGKLDNRSTRKSTCAKEFPCMQLDNKKDNLVDDLFPKFDQKEAKERKHN